MLCICPFFTRHLYTVIPDRKTLDRVRVSPSEVCAVTVSVYGPCLLRGNVKDAEPSVPTVMLSIIDKIQLKVHAYSPQGFV